MDTTGSVLAMLGPGVWPSWSPDGTRIAFARSTPALGTRSQGSTRPISTSWLSMGRTQSI